METLLDVLIVLYDECCTSQFKKEKTVAEFVELCKIVCVHVCECVHVCACECVVHYEKEPNSGT